MTQLQAKFIETPPTYDAIQWDGTLEGAAEIARFIASRNELEGPPVRFESRVASSNERSYDSILVLPQYLLHGDEHDRMLWPEGWLLYCSRPKSWRMISDEALKRDYSMVHGEVSS